jgi:hypothetical protein
VRDALRRVPAWAWLGGIVVGSALLRLWLVRGLPAPFVFVDELIYSELARSLAAGDGYAVRETPVTGYSLLYPLLIAPAYAAFDDLTQAYAAAKGINAVVMSLSAVPAYLLARRVARPGLSLVAAAAAVVVPSMAYTGTITTESLFYPASLVLALLLAHWLERPSVGRLAALLGSLAVAYATRSQALAFVPAIATAPLVLAVLRGRAAELRRYVPLYALLAAATIALVALQAVRGRSLTDLLGAYSIVGEGGYDVGEMLRYWLWHVEELALYAAVLPVAALLVLLARGRVLPPRVQEHLATTVALLVWSTAVVGAFASRFASDRVQDRYLFFLVPLLVVALVAWVELGAPRPQPVTAVAAGVALALPLVFPYIRFIGEPAKSDTLGLIPLWTWNDHLVAGRYWLTVAAVGLPLVLLFLLVPARAAIVAPLVVVALLAIASRPVWSGPQGFVAAGTGALFQGIRGVERSWIDAEVGTDDQVVALWTGRADRFTVNQNEFFNRRVGRVLYTSEPTPGGIGETRVTLGPDGVFRDPDGAPVRAPYALLDGSVTPDGVVVARDELLGTTLWRLSGPLSSTTRVTGLYPNDTWSGRTVTWKRLRCEPGRLAVSLRSDPSLFTEPQVVRATTTWVGGRAEAVARVAPDGRATLPIAVAPAADGSCAVAFTVEPTAVPSEVIPGSADDRVLGAHFDAFAYTPRS